jgi:septum formation protein
LLGRLGITPTITPADVDETPEPGESPHDLVIRLATVKAATVAVVDRHDQIVLAADTEVVHDGRALGKPRHRADADAMLAELSGRTHEVVTAVAVQRGPVAHRVVVTTRVTFRQLTPREIAWYVATGEPLGKAGGYALQGSGAALIDRIDGSDTNVIGLPLAETVQLLRVLGLDLLAPPDRSEGVT